MITIKRIIDISWPITEQMTAYKDVQETKFNHIALFEKDGYRKSTITLSAHAGTHVDAPSHFLADGETIEHVSLERLIGPCVVLDLVHLKEKITVADLKKCEINSGSIVLFKTSNSFISETAPFNAKFIFIDLNAAQYLAEKKVHSVGIDYLGIERHQPGHETHNAFLKNNIGLIEGLRLAKVTPGHYFICCLPLNVHGLDGSPARTVLFSDFAE